MNKSKTDSSQGSLMVALLLIFCFPVGLFFMWKQKTWSDEIRTVITVFIGAALALILARDVISEFITNNNIFKRKTDNQVVADNNSVKTDTLTRKSQLPVTNSGPTEKQETITQPTQQQKEEIFEVYNTYKDRTNPFLVLRSLPTYESADLEHLSDGDWVVCLEKNFGAQGKWFMVRAIYSGKTGYLNSSWLRKLNE